MSRSLADLLMDESAPWDFNEEIEAGNVLIGRDEFPDVEILSQETVQVTKLDVQLFRVKDPHSGEDCVFRRLVGTMADGKAIDIGEKMAVPTVLLNTKVDMSKCGACLDKIDADDGPVIYDGEAYHPWCMED